MLRLNVYRGHVISLSPGKMGIGPRPQSLVAFHTLPAVGRADVVLADGLLERIERHTAGFAEHADHLRAAGRSLKRGVLLHGPPGVGKTLSVMYLIGRMPGRTVLVTNRARHGAAARRHPACAAPGAGNGGAGGRGPDRNRPRVDAWPGGPAPVRAAQRNGRAARPLRRDRRAHHEPGFEPSARPTLISPAPSRACSTRSSRPPSTTRPVQMTTSHGCSTALDDLVGVGLLEPARRRGAKTRGGPPSRTRGPVTRSPALAVRSREDSARGRDTRVHRGIPGAKSASVRNIGTASGLAPMPVGWRQVWPGLLQLILRRVMC
jgi:hypothetical protein